ncbi:MAG: hypothetical protein AB7E60_02680 [Sphingobium sp.]
MRIETMPFEAWRNRAFREPYELHGEDDAPFDLTGKSIRMEVRQYGAQPGDALVTLELVTSDVQGIRVIDPLDGSTDPTRGIIRILIDQATLAAFPGGPVQGTEPNQPDRFVYDLVVYRAAPDEDLAFGGTFTLWPGTTVPPSL